ncbi:MAG TPA: four helix bundle protein [Bacteroidales bacterium]|nr:four helix bundle protein [Bacteroidales bacterium]
MKSDNVIQVKSYAFAVNIVKTYKLLVEEKKEYVLSKQLLKSGTSIGANTEEALGGQSEKDFYAKLNIVYKEARETHYWLRLLYDCEEILKIVGSITKTLKSKLS